MEKQIKSVKPWTSDCYGNVFSKMTRAELSVIYESLKLERSHRSFWNEGIRYQKKHTATISFVESLIKL
jgi:hypothetical protein